MSGYNEQHAVTMLNALQGTETLERFKQEIRAEVIEEILKALHPCNECPSYKYGCENAEYFEDTCKTEKSISWNELRIALEELKEKNK